MVFVENMKSMKIYKQPCFLPTVEGNKKKNSAVILLTPNQESSIKLMNNPIFVNKKRYESYFLDRDVSYYIGNKKLEEVDESFLYLEETKRSNLKDSDFGIPEDRKFPLDTEQHVRSAIKLFGHAEESKKKSLARRISRRASKYGIEIPETTQCYKYLHEGIIEDSSKIRNVIFDLGNVLVQEVPDEELRNHFPDIPPHIVDDIKEVVHDMWKSGDYENATYPEEIEHLCSQRPQYNQMYINQVYRYMITGVRLFPYTLNLLNTLKERGYRLYYLSNWNEASFKILQENGTFDFLNLMDGGLISFQTGTGKPDPKFYQMLLTNYNLIPEECIFFDDREENVRVGWETFGIRGNLFDYHTTYQEIIGNPVLEAFDPAEEDDNLEFKFCVPDKDIIDIKFEMDEKEKRWNSIVLVEGVAPKTLRGRSECLVIKDNMIYLDETESGICSKGGLAQIKYDVPGGGWDPNEPHDICAIRETNEEAKIDVKDVQYIDNYLSIDKVRPKGCYCDGLFSKVYIGKYNGKYQGPVADVDRADIAVSGGFYPIKEVYDQLNPIHQKAIDIYFGKEVIPSEIHEVFYISESIQQSSLDSNFKKKSISDVNYEVVDFHSPKAKKYIENDSYLSNLYDKNQLKDFDGELIGDKDTNDVIGRVFIGTGKDAGYIGALRVYDKYKGYGFGDILIKDAIHKYGGYDLNVFKDNEVALKMYKKYGFEVVDDDSSDSSYYMKLKSKINEATQENIGDSSSITHHVYQLYHDGRNCTLDGNEVDVNNNETLHHTPIPLNFFPNQMGVNLCSVDSIHWDVLPDGQIVNILIKFDPNFEVTRECYFSTINEMLEASFNTPEELSKWMKSNIHYANFSKLKSVEDVRESKAGSCHDQVVFELDQLKKMGYKPSAVFLIEYNEEGKGNDAVTHSFVYYPKDGKYYWFENAYGGQEGIHEFDSVEEIKDHFRKLHNEGNWGNVKKYPEIEFGKFDFNIGDSLGDIVNKSLSEAAILNENEFVLYT